MVRPVTSAQRKLARGVEHVKTLREEAWTFEDEDAYVFRIEHEERSPHEIGYRCVAVAQQLAPPHWPLLAGEAIQNLRSALDHFVWSVAHPDERGTHTKFPICVDPAEFPELNRGALRGITKDVWTIIERSQPYRATPTAPAMDRLELLRSLSNIDKHRTLTAVAVAIEHEWFGIRPDINLTFEKLATNAPLGDEETEICVFTATSETEFTRMDVQPGFTYKVRIEGHALDVLVGIAQRVFEVLTECETRQPISPGAAYPIYPGRF